MSTIRATNFQHASAAAPAIVLAADGTAAATVSGINSGPLAGFRNAIINGNFDHWQRGTSFNTAVYGADRWVNAASGSSCTMSRQAFTLGQTFVPGEPTYLCRMAVTSVAGAGNYAFLLQRIEDVRTFAGQQVTVSFWAKADASRPIAVDLNQNFGSGGSPSSPVVGIGTSKTTLNTNWQKITVTATVPGISGKTLGSDNNSFLGLRIWFDAGSDNNTATNSLGQQSGTFDIAQVQLEAGPVATPFERRPIGTELALCQRYYFSIALVAGVIARQRNYASTTSEANFTYAWPVVMRSAPSVVATGDVNDGSTFSTWDGLIATDRYLYLNKTGLLTLQWCDFSSVTASAEL